MPDNKAYSPAIFFVEIIIHVLNMYLAKFMSPCLGEVIVSSEAVEELVMLIWHCVNSYIATSKSETFFLNFGITS